MEGPCFIMVTSRSLTRYLTPDMVTETATMLNAIGQIFADVWVDRSGRIVRVVTTYSAATLTSTTELDLTYPASVPAPAVRCGQRFRDSFRRYFGRLMAVRASALSNFGLRTSCSAWPGSDRSSTTSRRWWSDGNVLGRQAPPDTRN
jgi:hypothetical protein